MEFFTLTVLVMLCSLVIADFGFSSDYYGTMKAKVGPGETKEVVFGRFKNTDDTPANLELELIDSAGIAELVDETINVPANSGDTELKLEISIPEDVAEGTDYEVTVRYKSAPPEEGMIALSVSNTISFPIVAETVETETEGEGIGTATWIILIVILAIIVIVVIWMIMKKQPAKK